MKVLIMGAGALGSYFGGRLQAGGHDVTFVARGAHLDAMRRSGLRIESGAGDLTLAKVNAVADPSEADEPDVVFFLVKNYDVEDAARALLPRLGDGTTVVTGQNGVTAPDRLGAIIGEDRVLPGVVLMPADIREPGVVRHPTDFHELIVGDPSGGEPPRVQAVVEAINGAGMTGTIADDIQEKLWEKFVMMSAMSALSALTRLDIGPIRENPATRALLVSAIDEAGAVGRAMVPTFSNEAIGAARSFLLERMQPNVHASMLDDLNRGKRIELDYMSGDVVRLGAQAGIETPTHAFVAAALAPYLNGAPG